MFKALHKIILMFKNIKHVGNQCIKFVLAANSLWRALMKEGLWNRVIKDKYMPFVSTAS
jgi:hypothetical protein